MIFKRFRKIALYRGNMPTPDHHFEIYFSREHRQRVGDSMNLKVQR